MSIAGQFGARLVPGLCNYPVIVREDPCPLPDHGEKFAVKEPHIGPLFQGPSPSWADQLRMLTPEPHSQHPGSRGKSHVFHRTRHRCDNRPSAAEQLVSMLHPLTRMHLILSDRAPSRANFPPGAENNNPG